MKTIFDLNNQSVALGQRNQYHRMSKLIPIEEQPIKSLFADVSNVHDILVKGMQLSNDGQCLGWRPTPTAPFSWLKYSEVLLRAKHLGAAFLHFGVDTPQGFVGIFSKNRPEWMIASQACYFHRLTVVPIYDTLGKEACQHICNQTSLRVVVCDTNERAISLLTDSSNASGGALSIRTVILAGVDALVVSEECRKKANSLNVKVYTLAEAESIGEQHPCDAAVALPSDLCTLCYTSGTTGIPKGVMITHGNLVATCAALQLHLGSEKLTSADVCMSFLPLAHMFQRACEETLLMSGASIGYYAGDILKLSDDMKALKPTFIVAVPRLLNRIYDTVHARTALSKVKSTMLSTAFWFKSRYVKRGVITTQTIWDKVVFKAVSEIFGGRVRILVTGSAPLHEDVLTFIRCALGCIVLEGYGQTENCAPATATICGDHVPNQTGPPLASNEIKLADVPDMGISVERDGRGEICIRGSNVFAGYYKEPEKTAEVLDADGWLHTGDIGVFTETGTLKIVDRRKNMFKLSQGEYIVPDKVEAAYMRHPLVDQAFLYGESLKSCVVALIVPNFEMLRQLAKEVHGGGKDSPAMARSEPAPAAGGGGLTNGGTGDALADHLQLVSLCADEMVTSKALAALNQFAKKVSGLQSFEVAKAIKLIPEPFTIENGLMTPTMKTKRHEIKQRYVVTLQELYARTEIEYQQARKEKL